MTARRGPGRDIVGDHLEPGETVTVALNGTVPGFTRWSAAGGVVGIVVALSVPRLLGLSFLLGAVVIVAVMMLGFLVIYYAIGKPMAGRNSPPMSSPYLALVLTDRRVLLLDRALGSDAPILVEAGPIEEVSTIRYHRAGVMSPQQLDFVVTGTERRKFEFPRSEPVSVFVDAFGG